MAVGTLKREQRTADKLRSREANVRTPFQTA